MPKHISRAANVCFLTLCRRLSSLCIVASGYEFLYNLLAAGTSISTPAQPYIGFLAPPAYIALASSLVVYPKITTQTSSRDAQRGSNAALRYLQCIHATLDGPAYLAIRKAFSFPEEQTRRRLHSHRSAAASVSPERGGDIERISGEAANEKCLWTRAEDFWHIIGWAFNCSVAHKKRWDRWKPWLAIMLSFLEADWEFCVKKSKHDESQQELLLQESLLYHYIIGNSDTANRGARRRIVKAILAVATPESFKDYPEVWEKETAAPRRKKADDQPLREVDFESNQMGDYDSDEDMQDVTNDTSDEENSTSAAGVESDFQTMADVVQSLGGMDAIELRQRLLAMVSNPYSMHRYHLLTNDKLAQVAVALPTHFTTISDFFDNVLEDFIQLPTSIFQILLSTLKLPGLFQVAFNCNLLHPLVTGKLPNYFQHHPTQEELEAILLPIKATTQSFAANAKISLILEQIVIFMMSQDILIATDSLRQAMEKGIKTRSGVYGTGRGKRGNAQEEDQAKDIMNACSDRLLGLLEALEISTGKLPRPLKEKSKAVQVMWSFGSGSSLSPAPDSDTEVEG